MTYHLRHKYPHGASLSRTKVPPEHSTRTILTVRILVCSCGCMIYEYNRIPLRLIGLRKVRSVVTLHIGLGLLKRYGDAKYFRGGLPGRFCAKRLRKRFYYAPFIAMRITQCKGKRPVFTHAFKFADHF